jgi:uncharacterized protein (DUF433 family)
MRSRCSGRENDCQSGSSILPLLEILSLLCDSRREDTAATTDIHILQLGRSVAKMGIGTKMINFQRITVDPAQMGGVPCVRHLRIPVATVLRLLAGGLSERDIVAEYPDLQIEDIRECLRFAASSVMERELPLPRSA